jgi:hypothetical protein
MTHLPPHAEPIVDFFDDSRPVFASFATAWMDVAGGAARLLGERGFHRETHCPISVRVQATPEAGLRILDEGVYHAQGATRLHVDQPLMPSAVDEGVVQAVDAMLRRQYAFPFDETLSVAVHQSAPVASGLLWKEPLEAALCEALGEAGFPQATRHRLHSATPPMREGGARWYAIDTGFPAPPDSIEAERVAVAAVMAYRMVADLAELPVREVRRGVVVIEDDVWKGTPLLVPPSAWENMFRRRVPETMAGATFLELYTGINDSRLTIDRRTDYPIRAAMTYVTGEAHRARLLRALPPAAFSTPDQLAAIGELLYQSHAAADLCGLSVEPANVLVSLAMELGGAAGIHGARLSGYGGGGVVTVLAGPDSDSGIDQLCSTYEQEMGLTPAVYPARD